MKEVDKIKNNDQGQKPAGQFDVVDQSKMLRSPEKALEDFKQVLITILENPDLDPTSEETGTP